MKDSIHQTIDSEREKWLEVLKCAVARTESGGRDPSHITAYDRLHGRISAEQSRIHLSCNFH
jgi:hypothetical protein